jgi:hypothetical protein
MSLDDSETGVSRCDRCGAAMTDADAFCGSCGAVAAVAPRPVEPFTPSRRRNPFEALPPRESGVPPRPRRPWRVAAVVAGLIATGLAVTLMVGALLNQSPEPSVAGRTQVAEPSPASSTAPTDGPSSVATISAAPSSPTPPPTAAPTPAPVTPAVDLPGTARVLADNVSVRAQPDLDAVLVSSTEGYGGPLVDEEVRLDTGTYVHVHRGPLIHDGFAWYLVMPLGWDGVYWNNGRSEGDVNQGWVAGGYDGSPWLVTDTPPPTPPPTDGGHFHGGPLVEAYAGTGNARIATENPYPIIDWDAATPSAEPCTFAVDIVTPDGSQDEQAVDETVEDTPETGHWFTSLSTEAHGTYEIVVTGTCSWTFNLAVAQG